MLILKLANQQRTWQCQLKTQLRNSLWKKPVPFHTTCVGINGRVIQFHNWYGTMLSPFSVWKFRVYMSLIHLDKSSLWQERPIRINIHERRRTSNPAWDIDKDLPPCLSTFGLLTTKSFAVITCSSLYNLFSKQRINVYGHVCFGSIYAFKYRFSRLHSVWFMYECSSSNTRASISSTSLSQS